MEEKKHTIKDKMYWWLSRRKKFLIGDEYSIELEVIDRKNGSAKIIITNLKNQPEKTSDSTTEQQTLSDL